jgi:hypothetical protein
MQIFAFINNRFKGGGLASDVTSACPHNTTHWMMVGEIRPSYAFFLRNTIGVTLRNVDIRFERPDGRPCVSAWILVCLFICLMD